MGKFEKTCPLCKKQFSSLLEYTVHIGNEHRDIPPDRILKVNKEEKWSFSKK